MASSSDGGVYEDSVLSPAACLTIAAARTGPIPGMADSLAGSAAARSLLVL